MKDPVDLDITRLAPFRLRRTAQFLADMAQDLRDLADKLEGAGGMSDRASMQADEILALNAEQRLWALMWLRWTAPDVLADALKRAAGRYCEETA